MNMGTGLTQIFITGEDASLEDISVASTEVVSVVGKRTTGRSQSAERILDEERAFTRAELVKQGSAGSCLSWQSSWAEEGRSSGQEELPLPDDVASHLVDEGIQLNSVLDSSPSRRQGSPSLVGFSLRPSPRRNFANSPRPESQPAFTSHQVAS